MYKWHIGSNKLETSALEAAVSYRDLQTVKQLLACGADVNVASKAALPVVLQAVGRMIYWKYCSALVLFWTLHCSTGVSQQRAAN
jgi:hypothetical protein